MAVSREAFQARVVANLVLPARAEGIPPAVQYVSAVAATQGLPEPDCRRLEGAVEEACTNVVQHAFAAGEEGTLRIEVARLPGALAVRIHDQGLPADLEDLARGRGLGLGSRVMQAFADEVRFHNLGHEGKCIELVKRLATESVEDVVAREERPDEPVPEAFPELTFRFMQPDETVKLARCIYHAYGYSYGSEFVYYPEKTRELLESGLLASGIAVTPSGDIVGHCALVVESVEDRTAESATAAVLPAWRGQKVFERLKAFLLEAARDGVPYPGRPPRKFLGLYSEAATIHPFTQKVNLRLGCRETGLLLAYGPASMHFKAIEGGTRPLRQSAMLTYGRTNAEPHRDVHAPARHRAILARIYAELSLDRGFHETSGTLGDRLAEVESRARPEWGQGYLVVKSCGRDLVSHVKQQLDALCLQRLDVVILDLPLADPGTPAACEALEPLGFFFGGVLVERRPEGDVLRLQYLNHVPVDLEQMHVVSDWGRALRDYVVGCMPA